MARRGDHRVSAWIVPAVALALIGAFFALNRREFGGPRCPILLYHRFVRREEELARYPGTESIFTITAQRFDEQLARLTRDGYRPVGLGEVVDFVRHGSPLPEKPVLISVDDGWTSNLDVMIPILRKHQMRACFFVTTSPEAWIYRKFQGLDGPLASEHVRSLAAQGYEIGSHTVSHPYLIELSDAEILQEFTESKRVLEEATGRPCRFLSIPGNFYDRRIMRLAREAGYEAVFTANVGSVHRGTDRWDIPRLIVEGNFSLKEFEKNLRPLAICTRKLVFGVKKMPPHLLGATRYMALREKLFNSPLRSLFIMRRLKVVGLVLALTVVGTLTVIFAR
jgi:peptidoglycan/xylan/chitin deacetylase (PgdA/CDA1 family)